MLIVKWCLCCSLFYIGVLDYIYFYLSLIIFLIVFIDVFNFFVFFFMIFVLIICGIVFINFFVCIRLMLGMMFLSFLIRVIFLVLLNFISLMVNVVFFFFGVIFLLFFFLGVVIVGFVIVIMGLFFIFSFVFRSLFKLYIFNKVNWLILFIIFLIFGGYIFFEFWIWGFCSCLVVELYFFFSCINDIYDLIVYFFLFKLLIWCEML